MNHKKIEEEELIGLLKGKDSNAFAYLYDHYSDALYGIIYRIVNEEEPAQDILQEVFLKVWNNIDAYDPSRGRLYTWLLNLTRNYTIDCYRSKEFRDRLKNQSLDDSVNAVDRQVNTNSHTDHIGLKETVSKMRPEYIQVIDLLYFKGYTQDEVSKEYGIPLGTVKTRLRSAIIQLREKLGINSIQK